jgi:hypothetical protein
VQNFYRLLVTSDEKVHDDTELTVLQAVTRLMGMKSKYNFLNQCYNDIVKLIIDLIPVKHNRPKDLYYSKKIIATAFYSRRSTRMIRNICIAVNPDMSKW